MRSALAHRGSYVRIRLYDRVGKDNNGDGEPDAWVWQLVMESNRWMHNDNYVYGHIPYDSSRGYLPLAVGDYNGDGKEDLAFYCPAKADGAEAHVAVYSFTHNNGAWDHTDLGRINLKDFTPDYGRMNDPWHTWHLPTVALSTTSTRLGEVTKSAGAKQYKTYDDLVVSVSVPTEYRDDDLYLNSITKIFKYENDKFQSMFLHEYLPFGDEPDDKDRRMNYVNTVDADLNGDGFKEIVVAGYKEENLKKPNENQDDNRRYGDLVKGTNYINIITYAKDESGNLCYQMLWDKPKEIDGQRNLSFYNAIEPIPICAGHYLYDTLGLKDQLCIQGIVFDCENSLISGAPVYTDQSDINYITDTQPYCDKQNFPDAVSFKNVYLFNLKDHVCDDDQKVINNCVSGRFFTGADVDLIVIISSDPVNGNSDQINIDISIISDVPGRQAFEPFSVKVYDDYFDSQSKQKDSTTLFVCFTDSDDDTFYYRWAGSYASCSAPVLYAIVQVPPFYEEANSLYEYSFEISTGITDEVGLKLGLGISRGSEAQVTYGWEKVGTGSIGLSSDMGIEFAYNHSWAGSREVTKTITFKPTEDCAVCYVVPMIVNNYEILETLDDKEPEIVQLCEPQTPVFTALTVSQYNRALQTSLDDYESNEEMQKDSLPPDTSTKFIRPENYAPSCTGDPTVYYSSADDMFHEGSDGQIGPNAGSAAVNINNNQNIDMVSTSVSFNDDKTNGGGVTLEGSISAKFGVKMEANMYLLGEVEFEGATSLTLSGQVGVSGGRTRSQGAGFSATYYTPERELMADADNNYEGVSFSAADTSYDLVNSRIIHYDPKSSQMYSYTANSLCYRLDDYTSDQGSVNDNRESTEMDFGDDVFVSSYYVDGYPDVLPPEPPEDFTVKSVRRNADGSADITLVWNSKNRNEYRKADGYNIYMSDKGSNLSLVHLVNRHSVIAPAGDYTAYTVHLEPGSYPEDEKINFYIAPAYVDDNTGGARIVTEGTLSAKASVGSVLDYTEGDLAIVTQPQNYYMTKDNNKETATFTIEAQRNLSGSDRVSFDWQRYDSGEGEWVSVQTDIIGNTGGDAPELCRSEYKLDIPGSDKDSFVETGIRCVAGYGSFSVPSDVATILYTDQKPAPADYYVVGTMNDWQVSDAYKLTRSTNVTDAEEYVLSNVSLTTEDSFLIVAAGSDKIATACYPANANRYGANGEIERSSKYTLRFRPHYDGDGWFHSCITAIDQRLYGDVDLSGTIDIQDATLLQRYLAEFEQLSTEQLACADANLDNQLNIRDVTHIQRLLVEAI